MATQSVTKLTEQEYLENDRANEFRSEYIDGEMLAMSGGTYRHTRLIGECVGELRNKLKGRDCGVAGSEVRVRTPSTGSYAYPDVSVVCGPVQFHEDHNDVIVNPLLLVEVLSPSTQNYDEGRKFRLYREIRSFREYLLVHSEAVTVSHFSRQPDDSWNFRDVSGMDASIFIPALSITLELADIYGEPMKIPL